jgi:hypothetical protein
LSHIKELIAWRASKTLSCQRETLHSQQLRSIKKSIDSDHGIYRDLRNVGANYPFERAQDLRGIQPNSGDRDYSRLSCGIGDTQLGFRAGGIFSKRYAPNAVPAGSYLPPAQPD